MRKIAIVLLLIVCCVSLSTLQIGIAFADTTELETETYYVGGNYADISRATTNQNIWLSGSRIEQMFYVQVADGGPAYYNTNTALTNCCANVAGSVILGVYDRYNEDLMPDMSSFSSTYNQYWPMSMVKKPVQNVTNDLYMRMGTNTIKPGTNENQFFTGMTSYCESKSTTLNKISVASNGNLNISTLQQSFRDNKPVVILSKVYNKVSINMSKAAMAVSIYDTPHIFVAVGYMIYGVYNENNHLVETFEALKVINGIDSMCSVLYVNYDYLSIDNAYRIEIT